MDLIKNEEFKKSVDKIVYWSKLFAVLFIIMGSLIGVIAILAIFAGGMVSTISQASGIGALGSGVGFAVFLVYGIIAAIYLIPGIWLLNFSNKTRRGLNQNDESLFVEGFKHFGKYYTFWGIVTCVMLSFYGLALLILIAVG